MTRMILGDSSWVEEYFKRNKIKYKNHGWSGNLDDYVRIAEFSVSELFKFIMEARKQNKINGEHIVIR